MMEFDSEGRLIPLKNPNKKEFSKEELMSWKKKYNEEEDKYTQGVEEKLGEKFREKKIMSKEDLIEIMKWKFQGRLLGRQKRMLNLLEDCSNEMIERFSKESFKSDNDEIRINFLSNIPSIKNSLSTVILSFYEPQNYGILDIHSWRKLFGKEPKDIFSNQKRVIDFLKELRKISSDTGLSCREVEKALFKKNLDENR